MIKMFTKSKTDNPPIEDFHFESLLYANTESNKHENQDRFLFLKNKKFNLFAVADGIGSFTYPKIASEKVIEYIHTHRNDISSDWKSLRNHFLAMSNLLKEIARHEYPSENKERLLGTTLILGIETEDKITFAYIGNGAILHLRGTISLFPEKNDPWFMTNILSPHSIQEKGREVLYAYLSNEDDSAPQPTIIDIQKDSQYGDAFIICTDGIYSADHPEPYRSETIGLLYKFDTNLEQLLSSIKKFSNNKELNATSLKLCIDDYLLKSKPSLTDDSTISVLLTNQFIEKLRLHDKTINQSI